MEVFYEFQEHKRRLPNPKWFISAVIALIILITFIFARADEIDDIIPCIIKVESNGNPNAVSPAGAVGLMQITPVVLTEWNKWYEKQVCKGVYIAKGRYYYYADLWTPEVNAFIGEWYLRRLKDHYLKENYSIERMLAAYNGGITRLRKANYDISKMPKETRNYVRKVMKLYKARSK